MELKYVFLTEANDPLGISQEMTKFYKERTNTTDCQCL